MDNPLPIQNLTLIARPTKPSVEKHSYTGPATVFGKDYQANYAPLTSEDGKSTGALFVGIPIVVLANDDPGQ